MSLLITLFYKETLHPLRLSPLYFYPPHEIKYCAYRCVGYLLHFIICPAIVLVALRMNEIVLSLKALGIGETTYQQ
jgi:hypothetical protein